MNKLLPQISTYVRNSDDAIWNLDKIGHIGKIAHAETSVSLNINMNEGLDLIMLVLDVCVFRLRLY